MELTAKNVSSIFNDCLFKDKISEGDKYIPVRGLTVNVGLNPDAIELHANEIKELLDGLRPEFNEETGGGYSFLEACYDKNSNHWGEHKTIQELLLLGLASGYASYLLPRELWQALPGGVPYFVVHNTRKSVETATYSNN